MTMVNKKKSILFCLVFFTGQLQNAENKSWIKKTGAWIQRKFSPQKKTHPLEYIDPTTIPMTTVDSLFENTQSPHTIGNSITYATTQATTSTDNTFENNQENNNKIPLYSQPQRKKPAQKESSYILVEPANRTAYDLRNDEQTGIYGTVTTTNQSNENTIKSIKPQYTVQVQNIAYSRKPNDSAVIVKTTTTEETFEIPYDQEEDADGYIAAAPASPELQRSRQPLPSTPPSSPKQKTATKEKTSPKTKKQENKEIELSTDHTYLDSQSVFGNGERHPSVEAQQPREPEAAKSPAPQRKPWGRK